MVLGWIGRNGQGQSNLAGAQHAGLWAAQCQGDRPGQPPGQVEEVSQLGDERHAGVGGEGR